MTTLIKRMSAREIRFITETNNDGPFTREECEYLIGKLPPNYPVPAITIWYDFEFDIQDEYAPCIYEYTLDYDGLYIITDVIRLG
jgi:hypothetical protein